MSYKLNNISLSDYNIIAAKSPSSTIAVSGCLDMPKRTGTTFYDWGDHHGVEPYVSASEINFEGRDISFYGLTKADDKPSAVYLLKRFYKLINSFETLVPFETPYGTFQVYVKEEIKVNYLSDGWCTAEIKFREPVVNVAVDLPTGDQYRELGINGIPFKSFGAFIKKSSNNLNRPGIKKSKSSVYGFESFQLTPTKLQKVKLDLVFIHDSYDELKTGIHQFHSVLASEGLHDLNIDMTGRKIWAVDGFKTKNIRMASNKAIAELSCQLVLNDETSLYAEGFTLADNNGNAIQDNEGNTITL